MFLATLAIAGLFAVSDSTDANTELFVALDADQDGVVASGEVADSQRIWFTRALRVADTDGDERLTLSELTRALTDPEPRSAPAGRFRGQRQRIDLRRLDRNGDGMITQDEVPERGKERFQRLLDRMGGDAVSVDAMDRQMKRGGDARNGRRKPDDSRESEMKGGGKNGRQPKNRGRQQDRRAGVTPADGTNQNRLIQRFNRLDANSDGKVSRREAQRATRFIERLDRNDDGIVDRSELPNLRRFGASRGGGDAGGRKKRNNGGTTHRGLFQRFDKNKDGRLTRDEAPARIKSGFDGIDTNGDGQLTRQEFQGTAKQRKQNSKS